MLIREAAGLLNDTSHTCGECGLERYEDFTAACNRRDMIAMAARLERIVNPKKRKGV